jgi:hypothetical protein
MHTEATPDATSALVWAPHLLSDETVIWSCDISQRSAVPSPLTILWAPVFALVLFAALTWSDWQCPPEFTTLKCGVLRGFVWALPVVGTAGVAIAGALLVDMWRSARRLHYAITDQRAMILVSGQPYRPPVSVRLDEAELEISFHGQLLVFRSKGRAVMAFRLEPDSALRVQDLAVRAGARV